MQPTITHYHSPVAWLEITTIGIYLSRIRFIDAPEHPQLQGAEQVITQLQEYFEGKRRHFELDLLFDSGTDFQREVWDELYLIPFGETRSYQQIAAELERPLSARAVGGACGANPIPIVIPCHRVLRSNGELGGFAYDLGIKQALLKLEGSR